MKKLVALLTSIFILCGYFADIYAESGEFSAGTDGWESINNAQVTWSASEGYTEPGCVYVVPSTQQDGAKKQISLRKNKWYYFSMYVKNCGSGNKDESVFLTPEFEYTDGETVKAVRLLDRELLSDNSWKRIAGYIKLPPTEIIPENAEEVDLYLSGELLISPKCDKEGYTAPFYIDDVTFTAVDGALDAQYDEGIRYWDFSGTETRLSLKSCMDRDEDLSTLVSSSVFPNVESIYRFEPYSENGTCIGPSQTIAMESGEDYDISVWIKSETAQTGDNAFIVLDRGFDGSKYGDDITAVGKVDISDGGWHRLKAEVNFPEDSVRRCGDARVYVCISNGSRYNSNNAFGRNMLLADFEIKKRENLIKNPYFIVTGSEARSLDHQAVRQPSSFEPWEYSGSMRVVYDPVNSFDKSKYYGLNTASGEEVQRIYQTVGFSDRDYTMSVWARLDDSYPSEEANGYIYIDSPDNAVSEITPLCKERWTKIYVPNCHMTEKSAAVGFAASGGSGEERSILLSDFSVYENNEQAADVTEISVDGEFDFEGQFPKITAVISTRSAVTLNWEYLLGDSDDNFTLVGSGRLDDFKSGGSLPEIKIYPEWAGMKLKIKAYAENSKGIAGNEFISQSYMIKKTITDDKNIIPFNDIFGENLVSNGYFEQGTDGWAPTGKAEIGLSDDNNSVGCAAVKQTDSAEDGIYTDIRVRRYREYRFSSRVKIDDNIKGEGKIQARLEFDNNGTTHTIGIASVSLSGGEWKELSGSFIINSSLDFLDGASAYANMYRDAKLIFTASRSKKSDKSLTWFYIDDVEAIAKTVTVNAALGDERGGWSDRTAAEVVDIDYNDNSNIGELKRLGEFPDVKKCVKITSAPGAFADSPQQSFYMDADKLYELSAWVKAEDLNEDKDEEPSPDYIEAIIARNGGESYTCHGRVAVSDGKWHHIKAVLSYSKADAENGFTGNSLMFLRYSANNGNVYGSAPDVKKTFYVAEFSVKELENVVSNPYYIVSSGWNYWYGAEYCGKSVNNNTGETYVVPASAVESGYGGDNDVEIRISPYSSRVALNDKDVCYIDDDNPEGFSSPDGAFAYGVMPLSAVDTSAFWYNLSLDEGTPYRACALIKAEYDEKIGEALLVTYVGDKQNIIGRQTVLSGQWTKAAADTYIARESDKNTKIGYYLTDLNGAPVREGSIYFENLSVLPDKSIIPTVSAELERAVSGSEDNRATVSDGNISMGYRCEYYVSDNENVRTGDISSARLIGKNQSDINEAPRAFYCNIAFKDKYICAAVTPVSLFGVYGSTVYTNWVKADGGLSARDCVLTREADKVSASAILSNTFGSAVTACAIFACRAENGEIQKISVEGVPIKAGEEVKIKSDFAADDNFNRVDLYVWLGSDSGLVRFAPLMKQITMR